MTPYEQHMIVDFACIAMFAALVIAIGVLDVRTQKLKKRIERLER